MTRCLRDRTLLLVHYGEGHATHQAHLAACSRCTSRYRRIVQDLALIGDALERMPAAEKLRRLTRAPWRRRVAVAAVLAMGVMIVGVEVWLWRDTQVVLQAQRHPGEAETIRFLAEVSAGLSSASDGSEEESQLLLPAPDLADSAMGLEWDDDLRAGPGETCLECDTVDENIWGGDGDENL